MSKKQSAKTDDFKLPEWLADDEYGSEKRKDGSGAGLRHDGTPSFNVGVAFGWSSLAAPICRTRCRL